MSVLRPYVIKQHKLKLSCFMLADVASQEIIIDSPPSKASSMASGLVISPAPVNSVLLPPYGKFNYCTFTIE